MNYFAYSLHNIGNQNGIIEVCSITNPNIYAHKFLENNKYDFSFKPNSDIIIYVRNLDSCFTYPTLHSYLGSGFNEDSVKYSQCEIWFNNEFKGIVKHAEHPNKNLKFISACDFPYDKQKLRYPELFPIILKNKAKSITPCKECQLRNFKPENCAYVLCTELKHFYNFTLNV